MDSGTSVMALLDDLSRRNVEIWLEGDALKFRAPAGAVTPDLRAAVADRKPELVQYLRGITADGVQAPLSYNQQALYFLHRANPTSAAYNVGLALRVRSAINLEALRSAVQSLVDRHETLRTTYRMIDDRPTQVVGQAAVRLELIDGSTLDDAALKERVTAEYRRPFDLEHGPIVRLSVLTRTPSEHILLLVFHHIAADGGSLWTMLGELRLLYAAAATGSSATLPPLTSTYRDFVGVQRELLASHKGEALLAYWIGELAGDLEPLALPGAAAQSSGDGDGATVSFHLPDALCDRLRKLGRESRSTLFTVLMASWQVLLARYTGQTDILVGTPAFGRKQLEFQPVVGDFMNTVMVRGDLSMNPPFIELLGALRDRILAAVEHEELPFSFLVQRLGTSRLAGRAPLPQTLFMLQGVMKSDLAALARPMPGASTIDFAGLRVEPYSFPQQEGQADLTLEIMETGPSLQVNLKYRAAQFAEPVIAGMCRHFEALLRSIADAPRQPVLSLKFIDDDEENAVLRTWNDTAAEYPSDAGIHTLFEAVADRQPGRAAVVQGDRIVTYEELNAKANALAHRLRALGIGPNALVGIGMTRTPDLVAALLAVLKTGAAYLTLDPDFPLLRLTWLLEVAAPRLIVTETALAARWPAVLGVPLVSIDDRSMSQDCDDCRNQPDVATGASTAYVIFTSGSTGRPKGIEIPRRAVVNMLTAFQREFRLTPEDRLLAVTTLSFDIAGLELLLPLTTGASITLATRDEAGDPRRLMQLLAAGVSVMQATPTTWRMLCDAGWSGSPGLTALCGGETCPPDLAAMLIARVAVLWNLYGPTETTVWSTAARITTANRLTIGRPIANTRVYVLDGSRQPLPPGIPGELWISGDGVALGYVRQPELTAERFRDDPFHPGSRMYRTGDLCRWTRDGRLEHLGRLDQQVKIRGFRIELPEVEAALLELPGIREAAVVAERPAAGGVRLAAYVVPSDDMVTVDSIRTTLRIRLPEYMVPTRVIQLEALPLTPNGKVDRRALTEMRPDSEPETLEDLIAPRTATERLLAEIWTEALGVPRLGVHDNFFDLGGHSLLITQLASRLNARHNIDLPLRDLFDAPTIAELAALIDSRRGGASRGDLADERLSA
jgi:amino acid adenylation domain-containing protein